MRSNTLWKFRAVALASALLLALGGVAVASDNNKILYVANNGTDGPTCGARTTPCRSISMAVVNSSTDDTIVVGPGRYGDLNGNGVFGEFGEEAAPRDCNCMIKIDKRLRIVSRDGALTTVLDAGGAILRVVVIQTDGVTFGGARGFTVTGSGRGNVGLSVNASRVRVIGNLATKNGNEGFGVYGDHNVLSHNVAIANGQHGFGVTGTGNLLRHNQATLNGSGGFFVYDGSRNDLKHNLAVANTYGFGVATDADAAINHSSAIGNKDSGLLVLGTSGVEEDAQARIRNSNIFGNGDDPVNPPSNCGLTNASDNVIDATLNFWGAATGPGPDPADEICNTARLPLFEPFRHRERRSRVVEVGISH